MMSLHIQHAMAHICPGLDELFAVVQHYSDPVDYSLSAHESPRTVDCSLNGLCLPWPEAN